MKVDVHKKKQTYLNWKERVQEEGIPELSEASSAIIIQYILDMELGKNVSGTVKGGRSYLRLCTLAQRMTWIAKKLENRGVPNLCECTEEQIFALFSGMERGTVLRQDGKAYESHGDYVRVFKAFWHWRMKVCRKRGENLVDITLDLDAPKTKPKFVWITKEKLDKMLPYFAEDEQVILYFVFDSLIRSPTEILSLQVQHICEENGEVCLTIPDEISKTFGRTMNLLYSGQAVLDYIDRHDLSPTDYLFSFKSSDLHEKLQAIAVQLFGNGRSHGRGDFFCNLTLYDFRHSGSIHLRILAKENPNNISLDSIRHRGGWTTFETLTYYTEFLGLDGKIERQGVFLKQEKHTLEKENDALKQDNHKLGKEVDILKQEFTTIKEMNTRILQQIEEMRFSSAPTIPQQTTQPLNNQGMTVIIPQMTESVFEIEAI